MRRGAPLVREKKRVRILSAAFVGDVIMYCEGLSKPVSQWGSVVECRCGRPVYFDPAVDSAKREILKQTPVWLCPPCWREYKGIEKVPERWDES